RVPTPGDGRKIVESGQQGVLGPGHLSTAWRAGIPRQRLDDAERTRCAPAASARPTQGGRLHRIEDNVERLSLRPGGDLSASMNGTGLIAKNRGSRQVRHRLSPCEGVI